jgi:stage II sporulation protein GA (sporulation sigma-E factor processing peptidase)
MTAKICDAGVPRARLGIAAALGGLYAVFAAIFPEPLTSAPVKAAAGIVMSAAAFGARPRIARLTAVFFAVSAAFAGAVLALSLLGGSGLPVNIDMKLLFVVFAVCYAVFSLVFRGAGRSGAESYISLTIKLRERSLRVRALVDTGSSLRDPITGDRVAVIGAGESAPLFPHEAARALADAREGGAVRAMEKLDGLGLRARFRLVPYSAVGVPDGLLPAFRPDELLIDGSKTEGILIAVSPNSVSDNGAYSAIAPNLD